MLTFMQPPLLTWTVCTNCRGRPSHFPPLITQAISRIAWRLSCCSSFLLFRDTVAPDAWPPRPSHHGCPGGDARMGIGHSLHHTHPPRASRAGWSPIVSLPTPSQTQLRSGRCPESVGRQALKTCELMLWSFKPSQHAAHARHSAARICCVSIWTMPEPMIPVISASSSLESSRRRVSYETRCPVRDCIRVHRGPGRSSVQAGTPPETDPLGPRSQGSGQAGLTVLSPEIMPTNEIRGNKGGSTLQARLVFPLAWPVLVVARWKGKRHRQRSMGLWKPHPTFFPLIARPAGIRFGVCLLTD